MKSIWFSLVLFASTLAYAQQPGEVLDDALDAQQQQIDSLTLRVEKLENAGPGPVEPPPSGDEIFLRRGEVMSALENADEYPAGTTLVVADGVYALRDIDVDGAKGITIRAETRHGVIFRHDAPDRNKHWGVFQIQNCDRVTFDGFKFEGRYPRAFNCYREPSTDCTIQNCDIDGALWNGILLGGAGVNWILTGNRVHNCCSRMEGRGGAVEPSAIRVDGGSGHRFRGNEIYECWGEGLNTKKCSDVLVVDNDIYDNRTANLYLTGCKNVEVRGNRFVSKVMWRPGGVTIPYAISMTVEGGDIQFPHDNITIENNVIDGGSHKGMRFAIAWNRHNATLPTLNYTNHLIRNNTIRNLSGNGYSLYYGKHDPSKPTPVNCRTDIDLSGPKIHMANPEFWTQL